MRVLEAVLVGAIVLCLGCQDSAETSSTTAVDMGQNGGALDVSMVSDDTDASGQSADASMGAAADLAMMVDCNPSEVLGCFDLNARRLCNDTGDGYVEEPCGDEQRCSNGECVAAACVAGELTCLNASTIGECRRDETGFVAIRECVEGSPCVDGACASACNPAGKVPSNIGCEYWSVDLDNYPDPGTIRRPDEVPHAVAISNTGDFPAMVTIQGPRGIPLQNASFTVDVGAIEVYTFPRLDIDGSGIFDRAFKISATQPVIAYQFNPLDNVDVASNDASLLLPKEGLGRSYIGLSYLSSPGFCLAPGSCLPPQSGYLTVIATGRGNTTVRITPSAVVDAGQRVPELMPHIEHTITLAEGEVLNLQAKASDLDLMDIESIFEQIFAEVRTDLTGTIIEASQPVAVFGGHEEAVVAPQVNAPDSPCCAEHLEQQLLPIGSWGSEYLAARSEPRGGSVEMWRIVAHQDGTTVNTSLAGEFAQFSLNRGEYQEIFTAESFEISSSASVMVGQYLVSGQATEDGVGDPALIVVPPVSQLRSDYQIIVPSDYSSNWVTIARMTGSRVSMDGVDVAATAFNSFGSGDYELAWLAVDEGVHYFEGDDPFSLIVTGYSNAVSYGYPGGLNLRSDDSP